MPIDLDIRDNKIIGPLIVRELEKTSIEVTEQATKKVTKHILRRQIEKRFGPVPPWADKQLQEYSQKEAEDIAMKIFDATTIEELFN